jgi:XTP/dITP diphosphohydrolase
MQLLIATANAHKAGEFRRMLRDEKGSEGFTFIDLAELADDPTMPAPPQVDEVGTTFLANACLKAEAYAKHYRCWALADDSGLEVDALEGKPGVRSARWAADYKNERTLTLPSVATATLRPSVEGEGKNDRDAENNALLLRQMEGVPDDRRTARFVCQLAVADPSGRVRLTARGTVEGRILREGRGENGFGYDPLFLVPGLGKTTAELEADQKHALSHRGNAVRVLRPMLGRIKG